jgi:hypothetical protein
MIVLFLLVVGVILPRSILNRKNCRTAHPSVMVVPFSPTPVATATSC